MHDDRHHRDQLDAEGADAVLEELLEVLDVTRHPAHEHAGLLLGEEVEAEALQVGEDEDPEPVHHPCGEAAGVVHQRALCVGDDHGDDEIERRRT